MKPEDAINHFKWKYTQSNTKVSKRDKIALNSIIIALNQSNQQLLSDNLNFCKLLIYSFKKMCLTNAINNEYDQVDYINIYSRLRDVMAMDANSHINSLTSELQNIEMQNLINNKNLNTKTILQLTTKKEVDVNIRKMLKEFINV